MIHIRKAVGRRRMIHLKAILSAVARTFGISSPEDLRRQKFAASKPHVSRMALNNQQSRVGLDKSPGERSAEPARKG